MVRQHDLDFLGRKFDSVELPKEKKYLLKYFDTDLQRAFLRYIHVFGSYHNFVDHTGLACQERWLIILSHKLHVLESIHKEARANKDMTMLALIESGRYRINHTKPATNT